MPNSQLNKLKSGIKNDTEVTLKISSNFYDTEVTLKISSNFVGDSSDENNFSHKLLLANTQVSRLRKAFANNFSTNIKLSKT